MSGIFVDVNTSAPKATGDVKKLSNELNKVSRLSPMNFSFKMPSLFSVNRSANQLSDSFKATGKSAKELNTTMEKSLSGVNIHVKRLVVALGSLQTAFYFGKSADNLQRIANRLSLVTDSLQEQKKLQADIYRMSQKTASVAETSAGLFVDASRALEGQGFDDKKILRFVNTINKVGIMSGQSASAIDGALVQLTQGLSANTIAGQEYKSIVSQLTYIVKPLAAALGVSVGGLKKLSEEGGLDAKRFVTAVLDMSSAVDNDFSKSVLTLSSSFSKLSRAISNSVGNVMQFSGLDKSFSQLFVKLADSIDAWTERLLSRFDAFGANIKKRVVGYFKTGNFSFRRLFASEEPADSDGDLAKSEARALGLAAESTDRLAGQTRSLLAIYRSFAHPVDEAMGALSKFWRFLDANNRRSFAIRLIGASDDDLNIVSTMKALGDYQGSLQQIVKLISQRWTDLVNTGRVVKELLLDISAELMQTFTAMLPMYYSQINTGVDVIQAKVLQKFAKFRAFLTKSVIAPKVRVLGGIRDTLSGFLFTDYRLPRAFAEMFSTDSLEGFLEKLKEVRRLLVTSQRLDSPFFLFTEAFRTYRSVYVQLRKLGVLFGVLKRDVLWVDTGPLTSRLNYYAKQISRTFEMVWRQVFAPDVKKYAVYLSTSLNLLFQGFSATLQDFDAEGVGWFIGKGLADGLSWAVKTIDHLVNFQLSKRWATVFGGVGDTLFELISQSYSTAVFTISAFISRLSEPKQLSGLVKHAASIVKTLASLALGLAVSVATAVYDILTRPFREPLNIIERFSREWLGARSRGKPLSLELKFIKAKESLKSALETADPESVGRALGEMVVEAFKLAAALIKALWERLMNGLGRSGAFMLSSGLLDGLKRFLRAAGKLLGAFFGVIGAEVKQIRFTMPKIKEPTFDLPNLDNLRQSLSKGFNKKINLTVNTGGSQKFLSLLTAFNWKGIYNAIAQLADAFIELVRSLLLLAQAGFSGTFDHIQQSASKALSAVGKLIDELHKGLLKLTGLRTIDLKLKVKLPQLPSKLDTLMMVGGPFSATSRKVLFPANRSINEAVKGFEQLNKTRKQVIADLRADVPADRLLSNLGTGLKKALANFAKSAVNAVNAIVNAILLAFGALFPRLEAVAQSGLQPVLSHLQSFGKGVMDIFYEIYDDVVGHSTWPDFIDKVNEQVFGLKPTENYIGAFAESIKGVFADLAGGSDPASVKKFLASILDIDIKELIMAFARNLTGAILVLFAVVFGGPTLKLAGMQYFLALFVQLFDGVLNKIAPALGSFLGSAVNSIGKVVRGSILNTLSSVSQIFASFTKGLLGSLIGELSMQSLTGGATILGWVQRAFGGDKAIGALAGMLGMYAIVAKNGLGKIQDILFGTKGKKGQQGQTGLLTYLLGTDFFDVNRVRTSFFKEATPAIAGIASLLSGVLLKGVSFGGGAAVGVPLLMAGFFGKDGFQRLRSEVWEGVKFAFKGLFGGSGEGNPFSGMLGGAGKLFGMYFKQIKAGRDKYAAGEGDFGDVFNPFRNKALINASKQYLLILSMAFMRAQSMIVEFSGSFGKNLSAIFKSSAVKELGIGLLAMVQGAIGILSSLKGALFLLGIAFLVLKDAAAAPVDLGASFKSDDLGVAASKLLGISVLIGGVGYALYKMSLQGAIAKESLTKAFTAGLEAIGAGVQKLLSSALSPTNFSKLVDGFKKLFEGIAQAGRGLGGSLKALGLFLKNIGTADRKPIDWKKLLSPVSFKQMIDKFFDIWFGFENLLKRLVTSSFGKIATAITAGIAVLGVAGYLLFGPGGLDKFKDRAGSMFDWLRAQLGFIEPVTAGGKKGKIFGKARAGTVDSADYNPYEFFKNVDFNKLTAIQTDALAGIASQYTDALNAAAQSSAELGQASAETAKALEQARDRLAKAASNMPQLKGRDDEVAIERLLFSQRSAMSDFLSRVGLMSATKEEPQKKNDSSYFSLNFGELTTFGGLLDTTLKAISNALVWAGSALADSVTFLLKGFEKWRKLDIFSGIVVLVLGVVGTIIAGATVGVTALTGLVLAAFGVVLTAFAAHLVDGLWSLWDRLWARTPTEAQRKEAAWAKGRLDSARENESYIPEKQVGLVTSAARDQYVAAQEALQAAQTPRFWNFNKVTDKELASLQQRADAAKAWFEEITGWEAKLGKDYRAAAEFNDKMVNIYADLSKYGDLKYSTGEPFIGTEEQLSALRAFSDELRPLINQRALLSSVEDTLQNALASNIKLAQMKLVDEAGKAQAMDRAGQDEYLAKLLGISPEDIARTLQVDGNIRSKLKEFADEMLHLQQEYMDPEKDGQQLQLDIDALKKRVQAAVATPVQLTLASINEQAGALGLSETLSALSAVKLDATSFERVRKAMEDARKAALALANIRPGAGFEAMITALREAAASAATAKAELSSARALSLPTTGPVAVTAVETPALLGEEIPSGVYKKNLNIVGKYADAMRKKANLQAGVDIMSAAILRGDSGVDLENMSRGIISARRELALLDDAMNKLAADGIKLGEALSSVGADENIFQALAPDLQRRIAGIGNVVANAKKVIAEMGPSAAGTPAYVALVDKIVKGTRDAATLVAASGKKIGSAFADIFGDQLGLLTADGVKKLLDKQREIDALDASLSQPMSGQEAFSLIRKKADKEREKAQLQPKGFDERLSTVNDVFGTGFEAIDFARFGESLYAIAKGFKDRLEAAKFSGKSVRPILEEMEKLKLPGSFLKSIADVARTLRDAAYEGLRATFERLPELLKGLSFADFLRLPPELIRQIRSDDAASKALDTLLAAPGKSQAQVDFLNNAVGAPADIVAQFSEAFGSDLLKSAIELNTEALKASTAAILGKPSEVTGPPVVDAAVVSPDLRNAELNKLQADIKAQYSTFFAAYKAGGTVDKLKMLGDLTPTEAAWAAKSPLGARFMDAGLQVARDKEQIALNPSYELENFSAIDSVRTTFEMLTEAIKTGSAVASEATKKFSADIKSGLSNAFKGLFTGQTTEGSSVFETFAMSLLNSFTNAVIDRTLAQPMSMLGDWLVDGLEGLFDGVKDTLGDMNGKDGSSGLFGALGGLLKQGFTWLFSLFPGMATGGEVVGPGTGTSDSIPTMLSHGEFVVNAYRTKRYLPLLKAINSGNVPMLASGGLVGAMPLQQPSGFSVPAGQSISNSQEINISITGDISRQTKAEIYSMLPQIAAGVNAQNKEQNYRG